ncbi:hypothetical protein ACQEU5_00945 [Marinactinospora thermotolerans]|uniref:DUF1648 domain-containing protein n=1 Tax=Marinactinospora thermotolerans DSM 45154 TaxID=1122192 RepID=A0A1T4KYC4_9ACTN|nr:hypothetical protein [Marinactinospora thermotolerans]SJZ47454.1 hypothetical protein SAMN02745673_00610 [Marinactinospora thermotolerans DSM 45154]
MTDRIRAPILAGVWGTLVGAALAAPPLALRDRLPDPVAIHWSGAGADGSAPLLTFTVLPVAVWLVGVAIAIGLALWGQTLTHRSGRVYWWGFLIGGGVFLVGLSLLTLDANLDRSSWSRADLKEWGVAVVMAASLATGVLAGWLGRGAPDVPTDTTRQPPELRLRPGRRSVWVGRGANPWLALLAAGSFCLVLATLWTGGVAGGEAGGLIGLAVILGLVGLFTSSVNVRVTEQGVAVAFGLFGWPVHRIPPERIARARAQQRTPGHVGGWGIRGRPGNMTVMLRAGECLVIDYRSGGRFTVSVDDAERGASLINALVAGDRSER